MPCSIPRPCKHYCFCRHYWGSSLPCQLTCCRQYTKTPKRVDGTQEPIGQGGSIEFTNHPASTYVDVGLSGVSVTADHRFLIVLIRLHFLRLIPASGAPVSAEPSTCLVRAFPVDRPGALPPELKSSDVLLVASSFSFPLSPPWGACKRGQRTARAEAVLRQFQVGMRLLHNRR